MVTCEEHQKSNSEFVAEWSIRESYLVYVTCMCEKGRGHIFKDKEKKCHIPFYLYNYLTVSHLLNILNKYRLKQISVK